jgi:hypothetical protein
MTDRLQEFCDSRGVTMRVDARAGVIRGVKVLGLESRNGRSYLPEALAQAAGLYEDAKVNVNHPRGNPAAPRDYQDRIGTIRRVVMRPGEGLFADFHFNPKHALAEQLAWDAENMPENVGFSHNVEARTTRRADRVVVEAITRVESVDLVADPATTRGLFESAAKQPDSPAGTPQPACDRGTSDESCLKEASQDAARQNEDAVREDTAEIDRLRQELEQLQASEAAARKNALVRRLLRECELPAPEDDDPRSSAVTSQSFVETLLAAADEGVMRRLVEDRARLVRLLSDNQAKPRHTEARPQCRDQHGLCGCGSLDAKSFVEAIT